MKTATRWCVAVVMLVALLFAPGLTAQAGQPDQTGTQLTRSAIVSWDFSISDRSGARVISVVDTGSENFGLIDDLSRKLSVSQSTLLQPTQWRADPEDPQSVIQYNGLGSSQETFHDDATTTGALVHRQTTEVLNRSVTVETRVGDHPHELVITDDWGGLRHEWMGPQGLHYAEDDVGPIVHIHRDTGGRLTEVIVAGRYRITYEYSRPSPWPFWSRKVVDDLLTGEVLTTITAPAGRGALKRSAGGQHQLRPRLSIRLENGPQQVEWDPMVHKEPVLLAARGASPYVLLSLREPGRLMGRSLTLLSHETAYGWERVDYTDTEVVIHVQTGGRLGAMAQTMVIKGNRSSATNSDLLDPAVDPCGGGGGDDGSGTYTLPGQPLSPTQQQTVNQSKSVAQNQLDSHATCRGLFDGLPTALTPPSSFLSSTTYRYDPQSTQCQAGVAAWTRPGSYLVHLCDGFFTGSDTSFKAATLIHEGLHSAGLTENPPDPDAMTSSEIQSMVRSNCGL